MPSSHSHADSLKRVAGTVLGLLTVLGLDSRILLAPRRYYSLITAYWNQSNPRIDAGYEDSTRNPILKKCLIRILGRRVRQQGPCTPERTDESEKQSVF